MYHFLRTYDWNIQVNSFERREVCEEIDKSVMKIKLRTGNTQKVSDMLKKPGLEAISLGDFGEKVLETRLKTSVIVPWKATSYLVEVSVTSVWRGLDVRVKPRVHWSVQMYGSHWESAINRTKAGQRRKDWGDGLSDVWCGEAASLEHRFGDFVKEVMEVQAMLERCS